MRFLAITTLLAAAVPVLSCDSCYGPSKPAVHARHVRRAQPGAQKATSSPKSPLAWGQINFLHTTDTHGWLAGHIKEQNYGADWGDFVSFTKDMKKKAKKLNVDLLLIDTGDLHDGNGLSDATRPDGALSNPVFENIDYDLAAIGNHELYLSDIAFLTAQQFAKVYGDKYVTSNVKILNNASGIYEYPGSNYKYFTTPHGLRIMTFGVLFDFSGNSNASQVIKAADLVKETWFLDAVNYKQPIDLFLLIGHNPPRTTVSSSTYGTIFDVIRKNRPDVPLQAFGGHSHIRDFAVYDEGATGLESGRYCETLGWVSMNGIKSSSFNGTMTPRGVPHPTQKAIKVKANSTSVAVAATGNSTFADMVYFRRYIDWNRLSFGYHAVGSQSKSFDTKKGLKVSSEITSLRTQLNLTQLYGCTPSTYCQSCKPFGASGNIFTVLSTALSTVVINTSRADIPRLILINTGSVRFDLVEGPFTYDDSFIVSPFKDSFQYIPNVPYDTAKQVIGILNHAPFIKREPSPEPRVLENRDFGFLPLTGDTCIDAVAGSHQGHPGPLRRSAPVAQGKHRRPSSKTLTTGYTTTDDFGTDGDDTIHTAIPYFPQPSNLQANASFPVDGTLPAVVDLVFLDYIGAHDVLPALTSLGANYTAADIGYYLPKEFTTNSYIPAYAKIAWQANVPNCPVGTGVES